MATKVLNIHSDDQGAKPEGHKHGGKDGIRVNAFKRKEAILKVYKVRMIQRKSGPQRSQLRSWAPWLSLNWGRNTK
jgi:hypothetical protein